MDKLVLKYVGNDSWDRPVYKNNSVLFVDVDPLSYCQPKICTKLYNRFDGEPDTPIQYMKKYKNIEVEFWPKRIVWR